MVVRVGDVDVDVAGVVVEGSAGVRRSLLRLRAASDKRAEKAWGCLDQGWANRPGPIGDVRGTNGFVPIVMSSNLAEDRLQSSATRGRVFGVRNGHRGPSQRWMVGRVRGEANSVEVESSGDGGGQTVWE